MSETARYHGAFFSLFLDSLDAPVVLRKIRGKGSGFYLINETIALCLKWSAKRTGPWTFTFASSHQRTLKDLGHTYGDVFICFVCGRDGIAGIGIDDLAQVLAIGSGSQGWISVRRSLRSMYEISGPDGKLGSRVGRQTVFERLGQALIESGAK